MFAYIRKLGYIRVWVIPVTSRFSFHGPSPKEESLGILSIYKSEVEKDLISKVEPVLESMEFSLRDIEVIGVSNPIVRVTLDRPKEHQEKGQIGIEDCEKVHRKLGPMFDLWDPVSGPYTLELSSPGEQAPLRTSEHFQEALGETIKFQTLEPFPMPAPAKARKNWQGRLLNLSEALIEVEDDFGIHKVPLDQIKNASWQRSWDTKSREGNKSCR